MQKNLAFCFFLTMFMCLHFRVLCLLYFSMLTFFQMSFLLSFRMLTVANTTIDKWSRSESADIWGVSLLSEHHIWPIVDLFISDQHCWKSSLVGTSHQPVRCAANQSQNNGVEANSCLNLLTHTHTHTISRCFYCSRRLHPTLQTFNWFRTFLQYSKEAVAALKTNS